MRDQARRCTPQELAYLAYWRSRGYRIAVDEPIPLSTVTPPSLATRRPVLDALLGVLTLVGGVACMLTA